MEHTRRNVLEEVTNVDLGWDSEVQKELIAVVTAPQCYTQLATASDWKTTVNAKLLYNLIAFRETAHTKLIHHSRDVEITSVLLMRGIVCSPAKWNTFLENVKNLDFCE